MAASFIITLSLHLLAKLYSAYPTTCAKCANLNQQSQVVFTTTPTNTYDISPYTCGQIKYLTAFGGQGDLSCSDTSNSITFQMSSSGAMRVLFGGGSALVSGTCCSSTYPRRVCNAPDKQSDINELCRNLGYSSGTFTGGTSNSCPEAHFTNELWTSDWVSSSGSITHFTCTGCGAPDPPQACATTLNPTKKPTNSPTPAPSMNPTPSPTMNPSLSPTKNPSNTPTRNPSNNPTENPTKNPTKTPTVSPTVLTLNPSESPTKYPSKTPTINPTNFPTQTPTFREGSVNTENTGNNQVTDSGELQVNDIAASYMLFDGNVMGYIVIAAIFVLLICCIMFGVCFCKKRSEKKLKKGNIETVEGNITNMTSMTNTNTAMIRLGSVSPTSANAMMFSEMSGMNLNNYNLPMTVAAEGGMIEMNSNVLDKETSDGTEDDGDNELFVETGANVTAGQVKNDELPQLPLHEERSESDNDEYNGLYKPEVTTGGADMDLYNKMCGECGQSVNVESGGKIDENDGKWYCKDCWEAFGE